MRRIALCLAVLAAVGPPAAACTFCAGGFAGRQTLREHHRDAKVVLHGTLKNPKFDPTGFGGTTELHVAAALKPDPALGKVVILPKYLPVIGDTPADHLVFGAVVDGKLDPVHGVPATSAAAEYVAAAGKLPDDPARRLAFFFGHLDSPDATIAADAFLEFAKAPDAEILKAKPALAPAKLRKLIADPN
ncbi:MAG: hypothetical protein ACRC7O_07155, partial [Fimbriiglobus sp.]